MTQFSSFPDTLSQREKYLPQKNLVSVTFEWFKVISVVLVATKSYSMSVIGIVRDHCETQRSLASILAKRPLVAAVHEAGCYITSAAATKKFKDWAVVKVSISFIFLIRSATQSFSSGPFDNWRETSWHTFLTIIFYSTESSEVIFFFYVSAFVVGHESYLWSLVFFKKFL